MQSGNTVDILGLNQGTPKSTDVYVAVDITDTSQSLAGSDKRYNFYDIFDFISTLYGLVTYSPVYALSATNLNANYSNGISGVGATLTNAGSQIIFQIDSVFPPLNSYVLISNQSNAAQNGIYQVTNIGSSVSNWVLTRSTGFNSSINIINGAVVLVQFGSTESNTFWQLQFNNSVVVGTTLLNFFPFSFVNNSQILKWVNVPITSFNMAANTGYIANNAGLVSLTLPTVISQGQIIEIAGAGAGGWRIIQNASQQIRYGNQTTTIGVGGSLSSTFQGDSVRLLCTLTSLTFQVLSSQGNLTYV